MDKEQIKILHVEDNKELFELVDEILSNSNIAVSWAKSLKEASAKLSDEIFDLIILDLELPDGNGAEFCQKLKKERPDQSVFILSGDDSVSTKVMGFSVGAEDYITKPFNVLEFKARIMSRVDRLKKDKGQVSLYEWKELKVDISKHDVYILNENKFELISLSSLQFKILLYFIENKQRVVDRKELVDSVWGDSVFVSSRSVDSQISKLRKKFMSASYILESIRGEGYKFNPTNL